MGSCKIRNGWENIHNSGGKFLTFLEQQRKIADLMKNLVSLELRQSNLSISK